LCVHVLSGGFNINSDVDFQFWFQVLDVILNSRWINMFGVFLYFGFTSNI